MTYEYVFTSQSLFYSLVKYKEKRNRKKNKNLARKKVGENLKKQKSMRKTVPNWECNPSITLSLHVNFHTKNRKSEYKQKAISPLYIPLLMFLKTIVGREDRSY